MRYGNNGGDGFVVGRLLANAGFPVDIILVKYTANMSPSCLANYEEAKETDSLRIIEISEGDDIGNPGQSDILIDAIFGSGLSRPVEGLAAKLIDQVNDSDNITIAVDAPSGFLCDSSNIDNKGAIVEADYTLTFQFPKYGFLLPENDTFVGHWEVLPIGIHPEFIKTVEVRNHYLVPGDCKSIYKPRSKYAHKGSFGHGLLIAGGYGKMGAAVLAAKAGMKAGAGLITVHIPESGNPILQSAVPAAMVTMDEDPHAFTRHPDLNNFTAIAIGPGLGTGERTQTALKVLIQEARMPMIFDADAINILAENKTWIPFIPKGSIFTPHPKEFERLIGPSADNFERNELQRAFSIKHQVYVVLKGAHTCISTPDGTCYFNSTGNPGMATGGSGDVLTGLLLGLMAQGYNALETCVMGVYLHGFAGDLAAEKWGYEALTANNITHYLGGAFKRLSHA